MPLPKYRVKSEPPGGFAGCPWIKVGGSYDGQDPPHAPDGKPSTQIRLYTPGGQPYHFDLPRDLVEPA